MSDKKKIKELERKIERLWHALDICVSGLDKIATTYADSKALRNLAMKTIKIIHTKEC